MIAAKSGERNDMKNETQKRDAQAMSEEALELRRTYNREWARKNRERRNALNRAYWERKVAKMQEGEPAK